MDKILIEDIKKGDIFSLNGLKPEQLAKMIATKYGVNPADFSKGKGDTIVYNPKRQAKPKQQTISKPEGMSVEEYKEKYVIPMKPELKDEEGEEWRPVPNKGRYFGGEADYSNYYEISNLGRLRLINLQNAAKSSISCGYDAPTRKAMQFHLNHKSGMNTCPDVKYMVADAFLGEHDLQDNMVIHIDGDYHNNRADNLKWVPRGKNNTKTHKDMTNETYRVIRETVSRTFRKTIMEAFEERYGNAIETIDYYLNLKENGKQLSEEQYQQLSDIIDYLKETDAADNPVTQGWIQAAEELLQQGTNDVYNELMENAVKYAKQTLKEMSGIHINPENKGKFTATKKRTGKSTEELTHSKNPLTRKRAVFAQNARKWAKKSKQNSVNESTMDDSTQDYFETLVDVLNECGWAYSNFYDVTNKSTGQTGTRFELEEYPYSGAKPCSADELQQKIKQSIPNAVFSTGQHRYAPEIKRLSVVLLDEPAQTETMNEDTQKPSWEEILKRINDAGVNQAMPKQTQQRQTTSSGHTYQIGNYTFNAAQHRLDGPNGSKYLPPKVSDTLMILCQHINQPVTSNEILSAVSGITQQSSPDQIYLAKRSMDVQINGLKKLFADDPNVNIGSVRGVGYRLDVRTGVEEEFDHHNPDYDEEDYNDELAWNTDAYWDEQMDNAINEAVKKTIRKNLK